jgi:hypothetical protein
MGRKRRSGRVWERILIAVALATSLGVAACSGGAVPTLPGNVPSELIPTFPPDDLASGTAACIDEPTMAIIDQLRATGADVPGLLAANKDALLSGLGDLESADPATTAWRDALVAALESGDADAAAAQVAILAQGKVTITPC